MIAQNLKVLRENIERKCAEVNRDPSSVKLVAVSKNFGLEEITRAVNEGVQDFGENKAQELKFKFENYPANAEQKITWHFIGNLQKNKVKYVVNAAEFIHSVDSKELLDEINKRAGKLDKIQKILLEVKTSCEDSKAGIEEKRELKNLVSYCKNLPNINLLGLMTIAPFTEDKDIFRKSFSDLRNLKDELNTEGYNLTELSMGMTSDYEIAIEEGATMIRVGSAIFGQRDYSKEINKSLDRKEI